MFLDPERAWFLPSRRPLPQPCGIRVVPVGQQRPQRRDERDGLVEHDVVARDRDLDDRGDAAEPVVEDLALLRGDQAVFRPEQRDPAVEPSQQLGGEMVPGEHARVELPRPAALGRADRGRGHVVRDVGQGRLIRDRAEPGHGRLGRRVHAQRAERPVLARRPVLGSHVPDRGVDGDGPGDLGPGQGGEPQRDQAAHAVADDHGRGGGPGFGHDGEYFAGPRVEAVPVPPVAVAVPGQVHGDHPPAAGQQRGDVVPPPGVGGAAVDEHDAPPSRVSPHPVGDRGSVDAGRPFLNGGAQRVGEPGRW